MKLLSNTEKDVITLYTEFDYSVEMIAAILQTHQWSVGNVLFKYLNNCITGDRYNRNHMTKPYKQPKHSVTPNQQRVDEAIKNIRQSSVKLITL